MNVSINFDAPRVETMLRALRLDREADHLLSEGRTAQAERLAHLAHELRQAEAMQ